MASNDLVIRVRADDQASGVFGSIEGKAKGLGGALGNVVRTGAIAGAGAIAGLGIASLKMAADFETAFAEVKTLLPNLSEEAFGKLKDDIIGVSKEFGIATDKSIPALYQAISAGVPPDNVVSFMETAAKASIGGVTDLETAVDGITSVVNAYGSEVISAQEASDQMFTAVRLGKTDFTQLSASLFNVIPTASAAGVSFGDVASQLAVITASGTPTSVATTQIRAALVEAQKGGTKLDAALRDLNGVGFAELIKSGKTMPQIFETLRQSMPDEDFKNLFGSVEAMNAVLGVTGPNFDNVSSAMDEMANSAGATDAAAKVIQETFNFKLNKAVNEAKIFLMELGLQALPHVTAALEYLMPILGQVTAAIESFIYTLTTGFTEDEGTKIERIALNIRQAILDIQPVIVTLAESFVSGADLIMDALKPVVNFILNNKPVLIAAIAAIGVAILVAFGPTAVAFAAVVGLTIALGYLRDHWDEIKEKVENFVNSVENFVNSVPGLSYALSIAGDAIQDVIDFIKSLMDVVQDVVALVDALAHGEWSEAWEAFKSLAENTLELFLDYLQLGFLDEIVRMVVDFLPVLKDKGVEMLKAIGDGIVKYWDDALYMYFIGLPLLIAETIGDVVTTLAPKGLDLLKGLGNGVVEHWDTVLYAYFVGLPSLIATTIGSLAGTLLTHGRDLFLGLLSGAEGYFTTHVLPWLLGRPAAIVGAIPNPLDILHNAGRLILDGLLAGMKAAWEGIANWLGGLGDKIVGLKGPPERDIALLRNNGRLIMEGLKNGMIDGWQGVLKFLTSLSSEVSAIFTPFVQMMMQKGTAAGDAFSYAFGNAIGSAVPMAIEDAFGAPATKGNAAADKLAGVVGGFKGDIPLFTDGIGGGVDPLPFDPGATSTTGLLKSWYETIRGLTGYGDFTRKGAPAIAVLNDMFSRAGEMTMAIAQYWSERTGTPLPAVSIPFDVTKLYDYLRERGLKFDTGGWLPPGVSLAVNNTGRPERVLGPNEGGGVHIHPGAIQITAVGPLDEARFARYVTDIVRKEWSMAGA
ncbi:MAG TPA: phage tail tape measure protein [Dehalococcoidia bacterium]|nr:phage tail tape measure protein [Dehalococcoidia bacterium]